MLGNLLKGIIDIAILPIEVTKDFVTLGGVLTDNQSYTMGRINKACKNFSDVYKAL